MKQQLQQVLTEILADMGVNDVIPDVAASSDSRHGEYTTNIAMRVAAQSKSAKGRPTSGWKPPMEIALQVKNGLEERIRVATHKSGDQKIYKQDQNSTEQKSKTGKLQDNKKAPLDFRTVLSAIDRVEIAPPGFLNVFLTPVYLSSQLNKVLKDAERYGKSQTRVPLDLGEEANGDAARIMVEFAHPNTHKAFHIGHLRNITTGESIVRLLEATGHEVIRANYQGDVGMHIAKCLWAMNNLPEFDPATVRDNSIHEKVTFLGKAYAAGSTRYEADDAVKEQTGKINKQIYAKDPEIYPVYQETRQWSLEYFSGIYKRVGTTYDRLYFESETYGPGKNNVLEGVKKGIFEESDGAVIFPGEKYGLHTRVFVTKEGNATYEGKDMGLAPLQHKEYHPDLILHVLGPEQYSYTRVMFKALDLLFPETAHRQFHKTYGWVKLKHGKMSSRTGQVVLGEWLLDEAKRSIYEIINQNRSDYPKDQMEEIAEKGSVAAVKYAFLKVSTNQEIAFDLKESVAFDGDSGPYLLYTYARCRSVLRKAGAEKTKPVSDQVLNEEEREIARLLTYFPEVVGEATRNLAPNSLCSHLFRLAQAFNLFYQKHPILGASEASKRLALTAATAQVLKNGLYLLGIDTVERM